MTVNKGEGPARPWLKASASTGGANCVEMRRGAVGGVDVRDSKDPDGPVLSFSAAQFAAWLDGADSGEYAPLTD
jgi:hypothetical protein